MLVRAVGIQEFAADIDYLLPFQFMTSLGSALTCATGTA